MTQETSRQVDDQEATLRAAWDWFVLDRSTGESTVTMPPNLPISMFWGAVALRLVLRPAGAWKRALDLIANGALTWWAVDELVRGTSPLRRTLGAVTLTGLAGNAVRRRGRHALVRPHLRARLGLATPIR